MEKFIDLVKGLKLSKNDRTALVITLSCVFGGYLLIENIERLKGNEVVIDYFLKIVLVFAFVISDFYYLSKISKENIVAYRIFYVLVILILFFFSNKGTENQTDLQRVYKRLTFIENRVSELENKFLRCVDCPQIKPNPPIVLVVGTDTLLEVSIGILQQEYYWKLGSSNEIARGDKVIPVEDLKYAIEDFNNKLDNAISIVCIGASSIEGNTISEETRASDRAKRLQNLVFTNIKKKIPVYGFNFGKYASNKELSSEQRSVVIIKIIKQKQGTDLEDLLKKVLAREAENKEYKFPIDIRNYSKFKDQTNMLIAPVQ
jgi:hypothetical protein